MDVQGEEESGKVPSLYNVPKMLHISKTKMTPESQEEMINDLAEEYEDEEEEPDYEEMEDEE
jgi:hypothetical protein